jgi:uncharacterized RDD family membrane protein YckC
MGAGAEQVAADTARMNEMLPAGFVRSLAAFTCDVVFVIAFTAIVMTAWTIQMIGVLPDSPAHLTALYEESLNLPDLLPAGVLAYLAASSSSVFGRRTPGMRLFGLRVVRGPR